MHYFNLIAGLALLFYVVTKASMDKVIWTLLFILAASNLSYFFTTILVQ